jgi:hypothetical protein
MSAARLSRLEADYCESAHAPDHGGVDWVPKSWAALNLPKRQPRRRDVTEDAGLPPLSLPVFKAGKK